MADFLTLLSQALAPLQGSLASRGWSLNNAWPTMIGNGGAQAALPGASGGLPATVGRSGLPALLRAPMAAGGGASGLARGVATAGGAATDLLTNPSPTDNNAPLYLWDAQRKQWVPNPAAAGAMPTGGSYGFGGGYTPAQPSYGVPTNFDGATADSVPLPRPRPAPPAAPVAPSGGGGGSMGVPSGGFLSFLGGGLGPNAAHTPDASGLIQRFVDALQGSGNPNPNNAYGRY